MKRVNKMIAISVMLLFTAAIAWGAPPPAPFAQPQVLLPGLLIPKFVDLLPVAGDISVINATSAGTPAYNINIKEFQAQILPSTGVPAALPPIPANTPSWVWGYLTDADVAAGGVRPSYLGPAVVAERGIPTAPTYLNKLPNTYVGEISNVQPLLPIDMSLDWANPLSIDCQPDANGNFTNLACGVLSIIPPPPQPTATHIHGGEVAPAYDGGPDAWETPIDPATGQGQFRGMSFPGQTYNYPNGQQEATIWFHDHALGLTRLNVYAGMAGIYPIVDPANPPLTPLPKFPEYDIPLIIQDRSFDTDGQIFYNLASNPQPNPTVHPFWIPEFIGDVIVVNGKTWPKLEVEQRQYRFRLLNGSNARFYSLNLSKGIKPLAIATDGGYLPNAVLAPNIVIGPGERYEVIVDFTKMKVGTNIVMSNVAGTPFPAGALPTVGGTDTIMQFVVTGPANTAVAPNTNVVAGSPIRPTPLEPILNGFVPGTNITRQLTLNEVIGAGGPLELVVNNSKFNLALNTPGCPEGNAGFCRETELPAIGDTEVWEIINITADAHPMHTHLVTFQILDRTPFKKGKLGAWIRDYDNQLANNGGFPGGGPPNPYSVKNLDGAIGGNPPVNGLLDLALRRGPLPYEQGWKDTAIMYPGEVTRIVIRWAPQDAPVAGSGKPLCNSLTPPITDPTSCVPGEGDNLYPFNPTELISGVGYVWHCHIIDHEDNEMMRNYTVMPIRQPIQ